MKTILDLITKAGAEGADLVALLEAVVAKYPDLAPAAQKALAELQKLADPTALAAVGVAITQELGQVAQLHFDGKTHAGDGFETERRWSESAAG